MSILSWFSSRKPATRQDDDPVPPDDGAAHPVHLPGSRATRPPTASDRFSLIADKVEALHAEQLHTTELLAETRRQRDKSHEQLQALQATLAAEVATRTKFAAQLKKANKDLQAERTQTAQLRKQLRAQTAAGAAANKALEAERRRVAQVQDREAESQRGARAWKARSEELQLDLDYLTCTQSAAPVVSRRARIDGDTPLPPQPFVVVLIDGDAYRWSLDAYQQYSPTGDLAGGERRDHVTPGGLAAHNIQSEVIRYMMAHSDTIPVTSKIVARAFCNMHGRNHAASKRAKRGAPQLQDFMVQFTEKMPLFDFFDCGRGKERADDKIRENFHLFVSNPNCHAIFLAACLDNGFARMLEQYADHPLAYQKIILVSPGYVVLEMKKLGFRETEWPSVFRRVEMPKQVEEMRTREVGKLQARRLFDALSLSAQQDPVASHMFDSATLTDLVPTWDVNAALTRFSAGVGVRSRQKKTYNEHTDTEHDNETANMVID